MAPQFNGTSSIRYGERSVLRGVVFVYLAVASLYAVYCYLLEINDGGQVWTTGDWLISYRAGFVRRGLTGSITYGLSDLTGINALYVAAATQISVYAALLATVFFILSRSKITIPVALLAMSPVFLLMPFFFMKLAMIKEMIGFLAVALVGVTAFTPYRWPFWAGITVFAASGFAHEINAFLAPNLLMLIYLLFRMQLLPRRQAVWASVVIIVSSAAAILTSMIYSGNGMGDAICRVMLSYGGRPEFCGEQGPTAWLDRDMAYGMKFTWQENVATGVWPWFVLGFVLSMAPFLLFRVTQDKTGRLTRLAFLAACLGLLTFAPLFVIASDWGRWIAMHVFCLTILTFVALRLGLLEERFENLPPAFLVFAFVWAMPDFGEPLTMGNFQKALTVVDRVKGLLSG